MKIFGTLVDAGYIFLRQRALIFEMTRRDLSDRYAGQIFGSVWAFIHPIFLMALYMFVFVFVFRTKIGGTYEMPLDYSTYILTGIIPWMSFQESMTKSCTAITGNASLVKQVVFPVEVLPVKGILSSMIPQIISMVLLIVYILVKNQELHSTFVLMPLLLIIQILAMAGAAYFLSALGVYFKDLKDLVQIFCTGGVYLLPIFYLPDWVPPLFKPILYFNPFSHLVWCYQDMIYFGRFEHPASWLISSILSLIVFVSGYSLFQKLKPGFGNVL